MTSRFIRLKKTALMCRKALLLYYSVPQETIFFKLRNGYIYFFVGLITAYMANANMASSLAQELILLSGLILASIGFIIAMLAYIRLVISRFVIFFNKPRNRS